MILDQTDKKIIEELTVNARTPFLQIAKRMKVSEGTIRKRVDILQKNKIIKKFTIETKGAAIAIVGLETNPHVPTKQIVEKLKELSIRNIFEVTGRYEIFLLLKAESMEQTNELLESIRSIKGVESTETFTVLQEH